MSRALRLWPGVPVELDVEREADGAVRVLLDPCGPEVRIPPGLWDRLLSLTAAEAELLREAAGPWAREEDAAAPEASDREDLRCTPGPAGEGECQVTVEGGLVILRPCPRARPGSCRCGPALVLVAELDVRLEREAPGVWSVTRLDDAARVGRLVDVPEPAPWA